MKQTINAKIRKYGARNGLLKPFVETGIGSCVLRFVETATREQLAEETSWRSRRQDIMFIVIHVMYVVYLLLIVLSVSWLVVVVVVVVVPAM